MKARIFHNPRCSKSRATLAILESHGVDIEVVEYLKTPPSPTQLKALLGKLGIEARDLVRSGEPEFKAAGIDLDAGDSELIELMAAHPKLIQRPIVEVGARATIGRPPEAVLDLIGA
jgi:arsenate reductase